MDDKKIDLCRSKNSFSNFSMNENMNPYQIINLPVAVFTERLHKLDLSEKDYINDIAVIIFIRNEWELMEILIKEINFFPTEIFVTDICNRCVLLKPKMFQVINDLTGINMFNLMVDDLLSKQLERIFFWHNYELAKIFIDSGVRINKLSVTPDILIYVDESIRFFLEYLLDSGIKILFSDKKYFTLISSLDNKIVRDILIKYGFDFTLINKIEIPTPFLKTHQFLIDAGVEPIKIAYLLQSQVTESLSEG